MQHLLVLPNSTIFAELLKRLNSLEKNLLLGSSEFRIEQHRNLYRTYRLTRGSASQLILIAGVQTLVWLQFKAHQSYAGEGPDAFTREQRGWLDGKAGLPLQPWFSFVWSTENYQLLFSGHKFNSNKSSSFPFADNRFIRHHGDFPKLSSLQQTPMRLEGHLPIRFFQLVGCEYRHGWDKNENFPCQEQGLLVWFSPCWINL